MTTFGIAKLREVDNHGCIVYQAGLPKKQIAELGWKKGDYLTVTLDRKTKSLKVAKLEVCGQ